MTEARGERGRNRRTRKKGRPGKRARRAERPQQRQRRSNGRRRSILLKAVAHPLRRRMLRTMLEESTPLSPGQLAKTFELPLGLIAYHANVLHVCGALETVAEEDG